MSFDRRRFLAAAGAVGALAACSKTGDEAPKPADDAPRDWRMVTSWARDFPGLSAAAEKLAATITALAGGQLNVKVYAANELVPPFEIFDAVGRGTAEMGHSASYYWKGKSPAAPFFCSVPFGLNAQEMNAWLYRGGGLALWRELYATFNVVPFPAGNTGTQLAGWFNREIATLADLRGLRMRIPGLGGEVMARLGAQPVNVAGADIFESLRSGAIDASEWVGPYNDLAFGLFRAAKYGYYPGWQEPGPTLECFIHKPAFDALPAALKNVVEVACRSVNLEVLADFTLENQRAAATMTSEHDVQFRRLPTAVLAALAKESDAVLEALAASDPFAKRVYDSYREFRTQVRAWHAISEVAFYQARG